MANEKNLENGKRTQFRSGEEAARNGKKGGEASGESRRRKKSMKEAADLFLSLPVADKRKKNAMIRYGLSEDDIDYQMAIVVSMAKRAIAGDARAAKVITEMLDGDKGTEENKEALDKLDEVLDEIGGVI